MDNYDFKRIVSKLGITVITLLGLIIGNVMISQTNVGARCRCRRTVRTHRARRVSHRRTKGAYVKTKRIRKMSKYTAKRRGRKLITRTRKEPRTLKVERRGTDDAVSVSPKRK